MIDGSLQSLKSFGKLVPDPSGILKMYGHVLIWNRYMAAVFLIDCETV